MRKVSTVRNVQTAVEEAKVPEEDTVRWCNWCRHRRLQAWACPGLFRIMRTHITETGRAKTRDMLPDLTMRRRTYSVQYNDKKRFPQLRIKCGVVKLARVPTQLCRRLWV